MLIVSDVSLSLWGLVIYVEVTQLFLYSQFLPVYSPSEEEKKDPALYASNVRRVMAE